MPFLGKLASCVQHAFRPRGLDLCSLKVLCIYQEPELRCPYTYGLTMAAGHSY